MFPSVRHSGDHFKLSQFELSRLFLQAEPVTVVRIDKEALQQCLNWGFNQTALVAALKSRQSNRATVAYHLVVDNRTFDHHNDYLQMELGEVNAARLQHPSGIMGAIGDGPGCVLDLSCMYRTCVLLVHCSWLCSAPESVTDDVSLVSLASITPSPGK